jgi:hypothetical protein
MATGATAPGHLHELPTPARGGGASGYDLVQTNLGSSVAERITEQMRGHVGCTMKAALRVPHISSSSRPAAVVTFCARRSRHRALPGSQESTSHLLRWIDSASSGGFPAGLSISRCSFVTGPPRMESSGRRQHGVSSARSSPKHPTSHHSEPCRQLLGRRLYCPTSAMCG